MLQNFFVLLLKMHTISRVALAFAAMAVVVIACTFALSVGCRQSVNLTEEVAGAATAISVDDPGGCPVEKVCWPMMLTSGNQLTQNGTLFGHHCTFLVDTGFTYSVLSANIKRGEDQNHILLEWPGDKGIWHEFLVKRWVATAQQTTNRLPLVEVTNEATCMGPHGTPISMKGELALVQPLGDMLTHSEYDAPLGGIIGASFMKKYVVTFDYGGNRCISYECSLKDVPDGAVKLVNEAKGGFSTIVVPVTCRYGDRTVQLRACIDTGAGASILAQRATRKLLPLDDPARERRTHARFGDGEVAAFEYLAPNNAALEMIFSDKDGRSIAVFPDTLLMLPEKSPAVSAMSGHDMLVGTACLQDLVLTIDYTTDPYEIYVSKPK
jgi:hypothetical protein